MPYPALFLLIATILPLVSFLILMFMGKRMGKPLAGYVGTLFIFGSFICSILAMAGWVQGGTYLHGAWGEIDYGMGKNPIELPHEWIPVGHFLSQRFSGYLDIGLYVDSLTIVMFAMITLVATLVHVFSIGYMADDKRFPRFFTYLGLFCFSMLGLVIGGTILQLFIFWELVGLCSYLLIGFWYEKKSASNAAIKAFVVNRVGDFGFLIGLGILFYHLGNVSLAQVYIQLDASQIGQNGIQLADGGFFTTGLLTVMGIGLFFGAVGKSAQFPLHVWLPDAMEGPTPVSALIHAATMVAAGVYLVGRIFPILTPDAKLFIAIIGAITLFMAALIAIAQSDIKKVLAYSTLSQLGYMILAMGVGSWVGGLFHLITHAFFKALLFLGSGSVIHAAHHEQEMPQYGGLIRKIPVTGITFAIAVLAIAGMHIPFTHIGLSGFYSKDMILQHAASFGLLADAHGQSRYYWLLFILPTIIAFVTPFYMTRCWMLTFAGKPRNQHVYDHAHEAPIMWGPLVVLAVLSVVAGGSFMQIRGLIENSIVETNTFVRRDVGNEAFNGFGTAWLGDAPENRDSVAGEAPVAAAHSPDDHSPAAIHDHGYHLMHKWVGWAPFVGIGLGVLMYWNGYSIANMLMRIAPLRWAHTWLYRRMYFDELYNSIIVAITLGLARLGALIDKYIIDGIVNGAADVTRRLSVLSGLHDQYVVDGTVTGVANAAQGLGSAVRSPMTGRIRLYVAALAGLVVLGLAAALVVVLSR